MTLPPVVIRKPRRKPMLKLPAPHKPSFTGDTDTELLTGEVQGIKASMPEERFANSLNKRNRLYEFRRTMGAPRGLPGWFELDFLVYVNGLGYPVEVDTAFTHRDKQRADVLHDARVLQDLKRAGISTYPTVIHVDGESDLKDQETSNRTAVRIFG